MVSPNVFIYCKVQKEHYTYKERWSFVATSKTISESEKKGNRNPVLLALPGSSYEFHKGSRYVHLACLTV